MSLTAYGGRKFMLVILKKELYFENDISCIKLCDSLLLCYDKNAIDKQGPGSGYVIFILG